MESELGQIISLLKNNFDNFKNDQNLIDKREIFQIVEQNYS